MCDILQIKEEEMFVGDALKWSEKSFGDCDLGDERRTKRLVSIGSRMASELGSSYRRVVKETRRRY